MAILICKPNATCRIHRKRALAWRPLQNDLAWIYFILGLLVFSPVDSGAASNLSTVSIQINKIADNLDRPLGVTHAGDGSDRLFVVLQGGKVMIYDGAQILPTPFLDIAAKVSCCVERGLLSLAFHPNFSSNGFFYVNYTDLAGDTVVARYQAASNSNQADANSESIILSIDQPFSNHNGGQLQFGPDGFLYIAAGDGGGTGDPSNNAQNLNSLLGKILRIDVDGASPFAIPTGNPFVGNTSARDEIWAYGLRNPWRFSFDRKTGDLIVGDVGQNSFEEINFQPASSAGGENYGWRLMEANACFNPASNCNTGGLTLPILEYPTGSDCAVIGGYRYRGRRFPDLNGIYLFGDVCSGKVFAAEPDAANNWSQKVLLDTALFLTSFGEDENGEIFATDGLANTGALYRIDPFPLSIPIAVDSSLRVAAPYWQSGPGTYTFIAASHPSLNGMSSQIGVSLHALLGEAPGSYGLGVEFTIRAGETRRVFIVSEDSAAINFVEQPDDAFIVGTTTASSGQLLIAPKAANPLARLGGVGASGTGFPDIRALNFWGAVVIESTATGFPMEFVGDMQDSRAFSSRNFSGVN